MSQRSTTVNRNMNEAMDDSDNDDSEMHIVSLTDAILLEPPVEEKRKRTPPLRKKWKHAIKKAQSVEDPWLQFHLEDYPTETAVRHRYSAGTNKWVIDNVKVKVAKEVITVRQFILQSIQYTPILKPLIRY